MRELGVRIRALARRQPKALLAVAAFLLVAVGGTVSVSLEALVRARLDDDLLRAPTRFYARPLVFQPGMAIDPARVERTLERLGYRRVRRRDVEPGEYYRGSSTWHIGRRAFRHYDRLDPGGLATVRMDRRGRVRDLRDERGDRVPYVALEPELLRSAYGTLHEERSPVPLDDVPHHLVEAILTIEDQRFFGHSGLDLRRIVGATLANLRAGHIVEGASTLTQQLAKNLYLSARRTPTRKLRELAMAVVLEARHSKGQILEAYLNEVYLGQNGAFEIHGVGQAAQHYFGKDVSQLEVAEAALLAGIIRGPSLYSPFRHPQRATERRDLVLRLMHERGVLTEPAYRQAERAPLGLRRRPQRARAGRYFVDYAAEQLRARHGNDVLTGGLSVFTTLDAGLQQLAEEAVREGLARLEAEASYLTDGEPLQAALVALDPRSGEVLALVGGRDYGASQFNRAVYAHRQPGSSFKPVVALTALARQGEDDERDGPPFTLATLLDDEPLSVETPAGLWQPVNYDGRFRGPLTLREALERSLNVPFARLGLAVGPERIVQTARRLGIESRLNPYPSIALGAFEVTPLELTRAYGVLAAGGYRAEPHVTLGVLTPASEILERQELRRERAYSAAEAYLVTSALRGAVERGTGRGLRRFGFRGVVAAKSGTTNDFRDAWFIGYTPTLVVGVWVGFDDGRSIGLPGSRAALPIFARFLRGAVAPYERVEFERPWDVEIVEVNRESGLRAGWGCRGEPEVFLRGTAPQETCSPYHVSPRRDIARLLRNLRRPSRRGN
jgi:penicillin-binding protein 1B